MAAILREYGVATTLNFPLIDFGATDFEATPVTFASGDTQIMKDEAAFGNTSNNPAHEGNGIYSLALTATEMQAARIVVTLVDQTATKLWEDQAVIIETYGNASAQHLFNLNTANATVDLIWDEATSGHQTAGTTGEALSSNVLADNIWDEVIESGAPANAQTARQLMRLFAAALLGVTGSTGDWSAKSLDDGKVRISATLDTAGNRTAVGTLDGS